MVHAFLTKFKYYASTRYEDRGFFFYDYSQLKMSQSSNENVNIAIESNFCDILSCLNCSAALDNLFFIR